MKIVSPFKDYYDGVQAFGVDEKLVYRRAQKSQPADTLPDFANISDAICKTMPEFQHLYTEANAQEAATRIDIDYAWVGFCGKLYPFVRFVHCAQGNAETTATYYNANKVFAYLHQLEARFNRLSYHTEFYSCRKPTEKELSDFFKCSAFAFHYPAWFQALQTPCFIVNDRGFAHSLKSAGQYVPGGFALTNPKLAELDFYRKMDAATCYQSIAQFLGGVLAQREPDIDNRSDKDIVTQHGFDSKDSFRKRPNTRA